MEAGVAVYRVRREPTIETTNINQEKNTGRVRDQGKQLLMSSCSHPVNIH